jgi:hypothetical protein
MSDAVASASGPYLPGAFDLAATATDNIQTTLYYNQSVAYSARVAVEQLYVGFVASSGSSDSTDTPAAVEVSYTQLPNALMQNSFSVGGVQYLLRIDNPSIHSNQNASQIQTRFCSKPFRRTIQI